MLTPLHGIRVVEFCNIAAGPYCGMLLADMGADVIKVEKPGGDDMRGWPPLTDGDSENFASINRGKRSIVLDLKSAHDLAIAKRLCARADVVLENNRPGVMARLGLGFDDLKALNPTIIFASVSAFGQDGPHAQDGGFDLTIQAVSGIMSVTGEAGAPPVKCGVPIADFATGLYAAFAIATALRSVAATGQGTHIDMSMLGASLGIAALQTSSVFGFGHDSPPMGSRHPRNAPYQAFAAADGHFAMAAGNNALFAKVCEVANLPELLHDNRFRNAQTRSEHQRALAEILEKVFAKRSAADWVHAFKLAGVPAEPINSVSRALDHPQVRHAGWVQDLALPGGAMTKTFGSPIRFDGQSAPVKRGPPALDGDRNSILSELSELSAED